VARAEGAPNVKGKLVHDLRRKAAREFRRAGVTEGETLKACGWKTRSMFSRYDIIDVADLPKRSRRASTANKQATNKKHCVITPARAFRKSKHHSRIAATT
jgi:hypothetical protein